MALVLVIRRNIIFISLRIFDYSIAPNVCSCPIGYNGSSCQNSSVEFFDYITLKLSYISAICNSSCINGGTCITPNTCQCTPDIWTGSYCQTRKNLLETLKVFIFENL